MGRKIRIVPRWEIHSCSVDRVNIIIEPGPSFGSGDHPSTLMALELLETAMESLQLCNVSPSVIDVGTGTGVLAIAAKSLGAELVVALDIDPVSVFTIGRKNVELNRSNWQGGPTESPLCFFVGELAAISGRFQIVSANLAAPVLIRLRDNIMSVASRYIMLSGIADEMFKHVRGAYREYADIIEVKHELGWNALLLEKL